MESPRSLRSSFSDAPTRSATPKQGDRAITVENNRNGGGDQRPQIRPRPKPRAANLRLRRAQHSPLRGYRERKNMWQMRQNRGHTQQRRKHGKSIRCRTRAAVLSFPFCGRLRESGRRCNRTTVVIVAVAFQRARVGCRVVRNRSRSIRADHIHVKSHQSYARYIPT